jgi:hypothetical protein
MAKPEVFDSVGLGRAERRVKFEGEKVFRLADNETKQNTKGSYT